MNWSKGERLYQLLPAIYRIRDAEQGEPLRALLSLIESELETVEADITGLYENWFIETCDEWVVPYIGDLLRARPLHTVAGTSLHSQRAYVANTLRYRRRKGTVSMLEQLARDVTGWPAHAVEFFQRLSTSQHVKHVRLDNLASASLRGASALELLGGPFEHANHSLEVRRIASARGRYNIPNIGLFLWRLQSYLVARAVPSAVAQPPDGRYRVSPLGNDMPLFNLAKIETEITHLAEEINVPDRLRRRALYDDLEAYRQAVTNGRTPHSDYFGAEPVFEVFLDSEEPLPPEEILICNLEGWDDPGWTPPGLRSYQRANADGTFTTFEYGRIALDPVLGRLALVAGEPAPARLEASYAYGFSADIGGGPYSRREALAMPSSSAWIRTVDQVAADADFAALGPALAQWSADAPSEAVIRIGDSRTYSEALVVAMGAGRSLVIEAADGKRPVLIGDVVVNGAAQGAWLTLNGITLAGAFTVAADSLASLVLAHCTLVPGLGLDPQGLPRRPDLASLIVEGDNDALKLEISRSITGALRLPDTLKSLIVRDSIVQSPMSGGGAWRWPALISGSLSSFPSLSSAAPTLNVQIGGEGPHPATLSGVPASLAQARDQLQAAIRAAHPSPAFAQASVLSAAGRLIVMPGAPQAVAISEAEADPSAQELRLSSAARTVQALISMVLDPFPPFTAAQPELAVTMLTPAGPIGPHRASLTAVPGSLAQGRDLLHAAIRDAAGEAAFADAIVASFDERLVVLPGTADASVLLGTSAADQTTFRELGFEENRPALAADDAGHEPGPPATLERTTVFGAVLVRQLDLASECIFDDALVAERRQVGCTRFCSLASGSVTPRRFRCQPDLALEGVDEPAEQERLRARLTPTHTSRRYGEPGYAQLGAQCAVEIRTGAEDGSEMGVFTHLKQPQREANLRTSLEEYLRFGLEAGVFFIT